MANYGDYGIPKPAPLQTAVRPPPNTVQHAASNSSLSTHIPISVGQVVALAREAMQNALGENQTKTSDVNGVELRTGVTIDLSHKRIQTFPDEVVDIIKNELERLALSHNQLSTFPTRFSECTSLRYLNVRNNAIQDFPLSICELGSLEILDLGRNKLMSLPSELSRLTSLKVLSVQKNRIETLPLCLADMTSLQVLKLDGNPLHFPPKEVLQPQASSPPNGAFQESEIDDIAVTSQIKRFLKQKAISDRSETESGGEESSEGTETPRPVKRAMSGRFPIKVNGTDMPDLRSPALPRPPPIPSRSHYRGLSQQNTAIRRPGVMPLTIGSVNERLRSNSESLLQANRDRSSDRSRRMGIVSRKASELTPVEELKANRISHFRGLSHGSAIPASNGINGTQGPASPADPNQRATYVRRLSSLPERKRQSTVKDPVIEAAEGILYALYQIHPQIQGLLGLARDGTNKRTSLERVFYNASTHVEELDRHVQAYMNQSEEEEEGPVLSNENVRQACISCVDAYIHICKLLPMNVKALLENGDPRYIRSLLLLIYGSCAEIRNASAILFKQPPMQMQMAKVTEVTEAEDTNQRTVRYPLRDKSVTPTRERPGTSTRSRSATVVHHTGNLRVTTDVHGPYVNGAGRSATFTSATPRSGESFASSNASRMGDFSEDDRLFEKIFLRLQESTDMSIRTLPIVSNHFLSTMKISIESTNSDQPKQFWQILIQKTAIALQATESLKARMSSIKLKEPGIRTQSAFWILCNAFIQTYTDLVIKVKEAKSSTFLFPPVVIQHLRPLQKAIKECSQLIHTSPWASLTTPQSAHPSNGSFTLQSPASQVALPMTPQSAALGPAVQATVPSTPQGGTPYNSMFNGNVFERADNYLSMNGGGSAFSSRAGTMTSNLGPNDGGMGPNSINSPLIMGSRYNSNSKLAF